MGACVGASAGARLRRYQETSHRALKKKKKKKNRRIPDSAHTITQQQTSRTTGINTLVIMNRLVNTNERHIQRVKVTSGEKKKKKKKKKKTTFEALLVVGVSQTVLETPKVRRDARVERICHAGIVCHFFPRFLWRSFGFAFSYYCSSQNSEQDLNSTTKQQSGPISRPQTVASLLPSLCTPHGKVFLLTCHTTALALGTPTTGDGN